MVFGLGNDLQFEDAAIAGIAIEVLLECTQAVVFHPDALAFDFTRTVTALVDQHTQFTAAANTRQITRLARLPHFRWPSHARGGRQRQQQQKAE
ncbi:hypothetical protein D3C71_1820920 [compost metagenome]